MPWIGQRFVQFGCWAGEERFWPCSFCCTAVAANVNLCRGTASPSSNCSSRCAMEQWTDISKWQLYNYLIAGGIGVTVLALLLYLIPGLRLKMPAIIVSSLACLVAGLGLGMLVMVSMGYQLERPAAPAGEQGGGAGTGATD